MNCFFAKFTHWVDNKKEKRAVSNFIDHLKYNVKRKKRRSIFKMLKIALFKNWVFGVF